MFNAKQGFKDVANKVKSITTRLNDEADYVVEQSIDSTGKSGYTKWNSGKIEQWGEISFSASSGIVTSTLTFPTAFLNTNYNVQLTGNRNYGYSASYWSISEGNTSGNLVRTTTTTLVKVSKNASAYSITACWRAIGKWK